MPPARPPPDPAAAEVPQPPSGWRLLNRPFWILMAFAALCLAAALVVATLGPALFAARPAAGAHFPAPLAAAPRNGREAH